MTYGITIENKSSIIIFRLKVFEEVIAFDFNKNWKRIDSPL